MKRYNLNNLVQFNDSRPQPSVLVNEGGRRLILLCLKAGQAIPEHSNQERVVVHVIRGHITFSEGILPAEMHAGDVVTLESGAPHSLKAHEDSVVFVLAVGAAAPEEISNRELDLRRIPHGERHPLVFAGLDSLAVGESFVIINDHDPVPLNRQMDMIRPGEAKWEYERREPGHYQIRITRVAPAAEAAARG